MTYECVRKCRFQSTSALAAEADRARVMRYRLRLLPSDDNSALKAGVCCSMEAPPNKSPSGMSGRTGLKAMGSLITYSPPSCMLHRLRSFF